MLFAQLLGWWYSRGWTWVIRSFFVERMGSIAAFFSISDLLKTLFAPFRQDALNVKGAPLSIRLQALGENIISRIFGLLIRLMLVIAGLIIMTINAAAGVVAALFWPVLPLTPVLAILLMVQGVGR